MVVDFTRIDVARATLAYCAAEGIHAVVGTTGFTEDDLAELRRRFGGSGEGSSNCLLAANFAIGAVLMSGSPNWPLPGSTGRRSSSSITSGSWMLPRAQPCTPPGG